jgi:predicted P-loop ATPase
MFEKVKAFATRTHDRARPAYGRHRIDAPRRCIFVATTNDDEYLKSQTGNRRFWPVKTGAIDIVSLRRDRDQLWAEAAKLEAEDASLTLPSELLDDARAAQDERREHDPWDDLLASVGGAVYPNDDGGEEQRIATDELLKVYLAIPPDRMHNTHTTRLKRVMRRLGWSGPKKLWTGTAQKRGYFRQVSKQDGYPA